MATTVAPLRRASTQSQVPRWRRRERGVASLMMLPQAIPFALFTVAPLIWVISLSFTDYDGYNEAAFVGLENYATMITDGSWWQAVGVTLMFAVLNIVIEIPLALFLALLLNRRLALGSLFRTVYFLPHVLSVSVLAIIFVFLLRVDDGVINSLLEGGGVLTQPVDWLGSFPTAMASLVTVAVWHGFGMNAMLFLVGMQNVPRELLESAMVDGAGRWQRFRHIIWPLLMPMIRVIMILAIVFTLRSFDLIKSLTDGGPSGSTDVMFTYLFNFYFSSDRGSQLGYASSLSVTASVIICVVSLIYLASGGRKGGH